MYNVSSSTKQAITQQNKFLQKLKKQNKNESSRFLIIIQEGIITHEEREAFSGYHIILRRIPLIML
jgi:ribosomal 30S subunit maturation factor RimM